MIVVSGIVVGLVISGILVALLTLTNFNGSCGSDPTGGLGMGGYTPQCTFTDYLLRADGFILEFELAVYTFSVLVPIIPTIVIISTIGTYWVMKRRMTHLYSHNI